MEEKFTYVYVLDVANQPILVKRNKRVCGEIRDSRGGRHVYFERATKKISRTFDFINEAKKYIVKNDGKVIDEV